MYFFKISDMMTGVVSMNLTGGYLLTSTNGTVYPERFACCKQTNDKYYFAVSSYVAVGSFYVSEIRVYSFPVTGLCTLQYCGECNSDMKTCKKCLLDYLLVEGLCYSPVALPLGVALADGGVVKKCAVKWCA